MRSFTRKIDESAVDNPWDGKYDLALFLSISRLALLFIGALLLSGIRLAACQSWNSQFEASVFFSPSCVVVDAFSSVIL